MVSGDITRHSAGEVQHNSGFSWFPGSQFAVRHTLARLPRVRYLCTFGNHNMYIVHLIEGGQGMKGRPTPEVAVGWSGCLGYLGYLGQINRQVNRGTDPGKFPKSFKIRLCFKFILKITFGIRDNPVILVVLKSIIFGKTFFKNDWCLKKLFLFNPPIL